MSHFPREKYMNVHATPQEYIWTMEDRARTFEDGFKAHLGRNFVNNVMLHTTDDPAKPGFPDVNALKTWCDAHITPTTKQVWSTSAVQMVYSINMVQFYNQTGKNGVWYPTTHESTGVWWEAVMKYCSNSNTTSGPQIVEVMNECFVHAAEVKTTPEEIIQRHISVADHLHSVFSKEKVLVGGPTVAWPEWQNKDFTIWNNWMGAFIKEAGKHVDFISLHLYDNYNATGPADQTPEPRTGANTEAILDLQEVTTIS